MWKQRVCLMANRPEQRLQEAALMKRLWLACGADGPKQLRVLLHQWEKITFPYLKAIYWVRVEGKSVWVAEWRTRTECSCWLWISPPPRICNPIPERSDGISAALLQHKQMLSLCLYSGLLMDTECVNKRPVHSLHQNTGMWRVDNQCEDASPFFDLVSQNPVSQVIFQI